MKQYLDILQNILTKGEPKQPVRFDTDGEPVPVENGTIGTFAEIFRHDMSDGFPLLTTKKMPIKTILVELEGFIKGITSKKWYQERGCNIWNEWANPEKVIATLCEGGPPSCTELQENIEKEKKRIQLEEDDLGPIYGFQWRNFGKHYGEVDFYIEEWKYYANGDNYGFDQLAIIADRLRQNPYDRRMVCSAWNPNQIEFMALPPCHVIWNVVVYGNKLNLIWFQRSCDAPYGIPFNIASYATLLLLLARHSNLEPGELVGTLNDCHIYNNQINGVKEQLSREPKTLPKVEIPPNSEGDFTFDIFQWDHTQFILTEYDPYPKIDFGSITV